MTWPYHLARADWHPPMVEPERVDDVFRQWKRPWAWAKLPGLPYEPSYPHWQPGMFSIRGKAADNVARGARLGLNPAIWLNAPHIWGDLMRGVENKAAGKPLCERCDGTGNQLGSMYQRCTACGGTGERRPSEGRRS